MIYSRARVLIVVLFLACIVASSASAEVGTPADQRDSLRMQNIERFGLVGQSGFMPFYSLNEILPPKYSSPISGYVPRRKVGSALSPNVGIGAGESITQTWNDGQIMSHQGHHISHYWNGLTGSELDVGVHFVYEQSDDLLPDIHTGLPNRKTGYNVYLASEPGGSWPRGQDLGCRLQGSDSIGTGSGGNLAVRPDGKVTIVANSRFFAGQLGDGSFFEDNMIFYQGAMYNCTYDSRSGLNTSFIDSTAYRPHWLDASVGNYSIFPLVATQVDGGGNVVTHVLLAQEKYTLIGASEHLYRVISHFRKVGDGPSGTWSAGQIIDTLGAGNHSDLAVDPWSGRVCITHGNPTIYAEFFQNNSDRDVVYHESEDYGLTWASKVNVTNFQNPVIGAPHGALGWETRALYSSDGNLHILFQSTPTSADPYNDGYWDGYVNRGNGFSQNVTHWDRNSDHYVKVANGTFMSDDYLSGWLQHLHCGFGGPSATYTQFYNISECDGKLFSIWGQFHSWANDGDYRTQPELLSDCAIEKDWTTLLGRANWEIMMAVAFLESPTLWDKARHVTNTFTPECGLPGDPDAVGGQCGNEYKPSVEQYALDETGMALDWPAATVVDLTPEGEGSYGGNYFLNTQYMDDQYPGPAWNSYQFYVNGIHSLNSMKWLRIACVEPVEASQIDVSPETVGWPDWVKLGQSTNLTLTVVNEGNVVLNVTEIGYDDGGTGWLSVNENPTPGSPFQVPAGVVHTATFDAIIDASVVSEPAWLEGEIWLKSDAVNSDSFVVNIRVLAADTVEPVMWDTVQTHVNMFDVYYPTEGECVALAIGNNGELGYRAGGTGSINLDYVASGLECGTRSRDAYYLNSSSAFTILADDALGSNARLTQVIGDADQSDESGFDPTSDRGSISSGLSSAGTYDSAYTGRFVNRDTTIAMERTLYGPRSSDPANDIINFMILYTKVYSGDGLAHDHVTLGNVVDWDVPSEWVSNNYAGASGSEFLYIQGTDTTGLMSCQLNTGRFATEAFGGGYTSTEWESDNCVNGSDFHSFTVLNQKLMQDTTHYRDGSPLIPEQPNPLVWWEETSDPGLNAVAMVQDQAVWFTYKHDYSLAAEDTLHYWTILSTVRNGTLVDLETQIDYAKRWYLETVRGCASGCCEGRVGDANGQGGDEPSIGDISVMIDAKFIGGTCDDRIVCLEEADINQSGGGEGATCDDITIGDISYLIDYLFITGPPLGLADCL